MFNKLQKEQQEKFTALMETVQNGIKTHSEQNKNISCSIEFLGQKYDELVSEIHTLKEEKIADRNYINLLVKAKIEQLDRNLNSSKLEVRNVPKKTGESKEDLVKMVMQLGSSVNIPIQAIEVRDVYRINTKKEGNQPVIAELTTVLLRDKIIDSVKTYNKKYPTTKFNTTNLKIEGPLKPIFVSESLTTQVKKLFFLTREFAKRKNYRYCWTSRGKIYIRRTDGTPHIRINNESDLESVEMK